MTTTDMVTPESPKVLGTGLEARGVHAWFGKNHVLSDINLNFAAGTVTALIGPLVVASQHLSAPSTVCTNLFQRQQWPVKFFSMVKMFTLREQM